MVIRLKDQVITKVLPQEMIASFIFTQLNCHVLSMMTSSLGISVDKTRNSYAIFAWRRDIKTMTWRTWLINVKKSKFNSKSTMTKLS